MDYFCFESIANGIIRELRSLSIEISCHINENSNEKELRAELERINQFIKEKKEPKILELMATYTPPQEITEDFITFIYCEGTDKYYDLKLLLEKSQKFYHRSKFKDYVREFRYVIDGLTYDLEMAKRELLKVPTNEKEGYKQMIWLLSKALDKKNIKQRRAELAQRWIKTNREKKESYDRQMRLRDYELFAEECGLKLVSKNK